MKETELFDTAMAVRTFVTVYLHEGICFSVSRNMALDLVPYSALGVVIGCKPEALRLARLQLAAYRKGRYRDIANQPQTYYPGIHFMMRVLADYLKEPPHVLTGESLDEPYYQMLFDHWREPDIDALAPACLAACDAHTHRNGLRGEFGTPYQWKRTPIEILLIFKLRLLLGLPNPTLDHPLMNTPLGKLPDEISFDEIANGPDDLIYRVRQRMMQDGYDEEAIFAKASRELGLA